MGRKIKLVTGYYYHIYNRGIDKRLIFLDKQDYYRFIHCLYEFNDQNSVLNFNRKFQKINRGLASIVDKGENKIRKIRDKIVEIICFCLMPNHFHLILKQLKEQGISKFMLKIGTGYAMYFNQKNQRTGRLFEGSFKSILITRDEYMIHLSRYIHLNPIELIEPDWKEKGIKDWRRVNKYLSQYRYSSYLDYIGKDNFPSVTNRKFLLDYFGSGENYKKFVNKWVKEDIKKYKELLLK
jgi:putative transposase